jgi:hypothetical protein
MFEQLKEFKRILVTGPHRSGTTIAMRMIAADLGYRPVDEEEFKWRFIRLIPDVWLPGTVLQAPNAFPWLPVLTGGDDAVIVMRRPLADIAASVSRQKSPKGLEVTAPVYAAEQGYALWDQVKNLEPWQRFKWFEVEYEALAAHPLWVPKDERENWHHKTWRNG